MFFAQNYVVIKLGVALNLAIFVRETETWIHATEDEWVKREVVKKFPRPIFRYGFEDLKNQPEPDFDFDEPVLLITTILPGYYRVKIEEYRGAYHADVYAYTGPVHLRKLWDNVGGIERNHVGEEKAVLLKPALF